MVIEIAGSLALVSVSVFYFKILHVWRWWSNRQFLRLQEEAETIRDRLLQESFAMRRMLEILLLEDPNPKLASCLERFNAFHQTLNALSDRLSPPYAQDDLSLAIAHLLSAYESQFEPLTIKFHRPAVWNPSMHKSDVLILSALSELLRIILPTLLTPTVIFVSLSFSAPRNQLHLEIRFSGVQDLDITELQSLAQVWRFLTEGHCSYQYNQQTLTWYYWQQRSLCS